MVTLSHNPPCVVVSSLTTQWTNEKYVSLSISKIAQGTSVQRRDRGPSHKHLMFPFVLGIQPSYIPPPHKLRESGGFERDYTISVRVACHGVRNIGCIKL